MYTSDTDRRLNAGIRYLIAAVVVAAAGWLYELFSHGVYSKYMIYAFMVPLVCGALPNFLTARRNARGNKKTASSGTASMLQLTAVATLTAGSLIKGVLDIYGTTNRLTAVYPVIGLGLAIAAIVTYIWQYRSASEEP